MEHFVQLSDDEIIDSHTHCGGILLSNLLMGSYPYSQDTLDLVRKMRANGVKYSICFPFPIGQNFDSLFTPELFNSILAKEVVAFGEHALLPFAFVRLDDTIKSQLKHLEQLFNSCRFYGIKLYPPCDKYSICNKEIEDILSSFIKSYDFPIVVHTSFDGFGNPDIILEYAKRHPEIRISFAHAARFKVTTLSSIKSLDNVFLDSSPLHMLCAVMQRAVEKKRDGIDEFTFDNPPNVLYQLALRFPDKLLWGSDSPCSFLTNFSDNALVDFSEKYMYENDVNTLRSLPTYLIKQIANNNTVRFLFG